ncbi:MAG: adenine nucleotide alpha hydrolase family protein [Thermoflexales bacterium]|nr:adenine nucleotide alpha hydrolase family protein [Thermoflexales bacterium]
MNKTGSKCLKCGGVAVINMRQHKLALCEEHFLEWLPQQVQRSIEKYKMFTPEDRLLVAVSGGKDSLSLWDILLRLGYQADGLYISLGIGSGDEDDAVEDNGGDYSQQSLARCQEFVSGFRFQVSGQPALHVVDIAREYGESIPQLAARTTRGRGARRACSVCGLVKRHVMNRVTRDGGYGVLATGHNLDDEAAVLFGNVLHWQTGYLLRQAPVLPADKPGLARKVKPLCRLYEREMAAYALVRGIDYIYDECPYAVGASSIYYKEQLNQMELDHPGAKLQFYLGFLQARQAGFFASQVDQVELAACDNCGQPTSVPTAGGQRLCAFCRLWDKDSLPLEC